MSSGTLDTLQNSGTRLAGGGRGLGVSATSMNSSDLSMGPLTPSGAFGVGRTLPKGGGGPQFGLATPVNTGVGHHSTQQPQQEQRQQHFEQPHHQQTSSSEVTKLSNSSHDPHQHQSQVNHHHSSSINKTSALLKQLSQEVSSLISSQDAHRDDYYASLPNSDLVKLTKSLAISHYTFLERALPLVGSTAGGTSGGGSASSKYDGTPSEGTSRIPSPGGGTLDEFIPAGHQSSDYCIGGNASFMQHNTGGRGGGGFISITNDEAYDPHSYSSIQSAAIRDPVQETSKAVCSTDDAGIHMINDYIVMEQIGEGATSKVFLAMDLVKNVPVAMKVVHRSSKLFAVAVTAAAKKQEALQREIAVMKKLRHKHIVALYEVIDDPEAHKLYLVMHFVDKGPIARVGSDLRCDPLPLSPLASYARQICAGLAYLHKRKIVHRDIKPENILVDSDGNAYLADFGVSEIIEHETDATAAGFRGTVLFLAPELVRDGCAEDGFAVDVWALGVTLYALVTGMMPFTNREEILSKDLGLSSSDCNSGNAKEGKEEESKKKRRGSSMGLVPSEWKAVLGAMLERDVKRRPSITQVRLKIKAIEARATAEEVQEGAVSVTNTEVTSALSTARKGMPHHHQGGLMTPQTSNLAAILQQHQIAVTAAASRSVSRAGSFAQPRSGRGATTTASTVVSPSTSVYANNVGSLVGGTPGTVSLFDSGFLQHPLPAAPSTSTSSSQPHQSVASSANNTSISPSPKMASIATVAPQHTATAGGRVTASSRRGSTDSAVITSSLFGACGLGSAMTSISSRSCGEESALKDSSLTELHTPNSATTTVNNNTNNCNNQFLSGGGDGEEDGWDPQRVSSGDVLNMLLNTDNASSATTTAAGRKKSTRPGSSLVGVTPPLAPTSTTNSMGSSPSMTTTAVPPHLHRHHHQQQQQQPGNTGRAGGSAEFSLTYGSESTVDLVPSSTAVQSSTTTIGTAVPNSLSGSRSHLEDSTASSTVPVVHASSAGLSVKEQPGSPASTDDDTQLASTTLNSTIAPSPPKGTRASSKPNTARLSLRSDESNDDNKLVTEREARRSTTTSGSSGDPGPKDPLIAKPNNSSKRFASGTDSSVPFVYHTPQRLTNPSAAQTFTVHDDDDDDDDEFTKDPLGSPSSSLPVGFGVSVATAAPPSCTSSCASSVVGGGDVGYDSPRRISIASSGAAVVATRITTTTTRGAHLHQDDDEQHTVASTAGDKTSSRISVMGGGPSSSDPLPHSFNRNECNEQHGAFGDDDDDEEDDEDDEDDDAGGGASVPLPPSSSTPHTTSVGRRRIVDEAGRTTTTKQKTVVSLELQPSYRHRQLQEHHQSHAPLTTTNGVTENRTMLSVASLRSQSGSYVGHSSGTNSTSSAVFGGGGGVGVRRHSQGESDSIVASPDGQQEEVELLHELHSVESGFKLPPNISLPSVKLPSSPW